eukprot:TRINITY_DN105374_c0_g1_i1.p1 TRINITY_DN105374_c0_g1~~TRINITY_DN105374_c0_g1_i1.p1  ORF type:complete len:379 (-),score=115.18 TRINITY_DN105374_c0_g1_i1:158-1294(-)
MADDRIWKAVKAGDEEELIKISKDAANEPVSKEALLYKAEESIHGFSMMTLHLTPLQIACAKKGGATMVPILLGMGFAEEQLKECPNTWQGDKANYTAIQIAAFTANAKAVEECLAAGFLEEQLLGEGDGGFTALMFAARSEAMTVATVLAGGYLKEQLSAVNKKGETALMIAASACWAKMNSVALLLGAALETFEDDAYLEYLLRKDRDKGYTALMRAAISGSPRLVNEVLAGGHVEEQLFRKDEAKEMTALMHAATCFDTSATVTALLEAGFVEQQVLVRDRSHANALMHVATQGRKGSVEALLCAGFAALQLAPDEEWKCSAMTAAEKSCRNDMIAHVEQATAIVEWAEKHGEDVAACLKEAEDDPDAFKAKMAA